MIRALASMMLLLPLPALAFGAAEFPPGDLCRAAIASAEHQWRVPDRLMAAIGVVESGKRDASGQVSPWPWTINAEGVGHWFATKAEAIAAVQSLQASGVRSIDVGCMQINLMHHADAFGSLEQAFDPGANASYAGRFLTQLYGQTGTWPKAAAGYHSLTPEIGEEYERRVMAVWQHQPEGPNVPGQAYASASSAFGRVSGLGSFGTWSGGGRFVPMPPNVILYGNGGGRVLPMQAAAGAGGGAGGMGLGRSLASYRAAPTRLAMVVGR
jgi:hypothetical protein